jgi:hypothetical protein
MIVRADTGWQLFSVEYSDFSLQPNLHEVRSISYQAGKPRPLREQKSAARLRGLARAWRPT